DLNYRAKLWSPQEASKTLSAMMEDVDILITTRGDTRTILDIEAETDKALAAILLDQYPFEVVAVSYREGDTVWRCLWSALARTRNKTFSTRTYTIDIVDQVGRGYSLLDQKTVYKTIANAENGYYRYISPKVKNPGPEDQAFDARINTYTVTALKLS
ncbi:MAG: hypothetical protein KJP23_17325, partial [Deltaproteobacteria bacterium]|nr:hypothetical protein [Deltaproteobacteria bacterium]